MLLEDARKIKEAQALKQTSVEIRDKIEEQQEPPRSTVMKKIKKGK